MQCSSPPKSNPGPARMPCYQCGEAADRACTSCERFFCRFHGGERQVAVHVGGGLFGGLRWEYPVRALCDRCTPDQSKVKAHAAAMGILSIAVLIFLIIMGIWFMTEYAKWRH